MIKHIIVDTSYLLELYKIDKQINGKCWTEKSHQIIKAKFDEEKENGSYFYFPIPVLFEFANHIADANNRQQGVAGLIDLIDKCQNINYFYSIAPCSNAESMKNFIQDLLKVVNRFNTEFLIEKLSLADSSTIVQAELLFEKYKTRNKLESNKIHIWTTHKALKSREPNPEENAYL